MLYALQTAKFEDKHGEYAIAIASDTMRPKKAINARDKGNEARPNDDHRASWSWQGEWWLGVGRRSQLCSQSQDAR